MIVVLSICSKKLLVNAISIELFSNTESLVQSSLRVRISSFAYLLILGFISIAIFSPPCAFILFINSQYPAAISTILALGGIYF